MRSFDRQWTFQDPRLAKTESPSLWASLSEEQIFLTTMTTTSLGHGPAATLTTAIPDKHFFSGRGGKDIIPLYRDAKGTPNVDPQLLTQLTLRHRQVDTDAAEVTVERLFAYVFGVLAGTDYTDRFHAALQTPGPRIPLTADPELFARMAAHGEKLIWLQTFGERGHSDSLTLDEVTWKVEPTRLPASKSEITFDAATGTLRVADGELLGVPEDVWRFAVSGMEIIPKWLGYRMAKPAGRAASSTSPLDHMRPSGWLFEWNTELVEIVVAIKETLALAPVGVALLNAIIIGPMITADELPQIPPALRQPPATNTADAGQLALPEGG